MEKQALERTKKAYYLFFEAMKKDDIVAVVEAAYDLFDHSPTVLTDRYERVLVQIPQHKIGDLAFDLLIEHSHITGETLWMFQQDMVGDIPPLHKPVYLDDGYCKAYPRITGGVYDQNSLYGHYGIMLGNRPLQPEDLEIAELFVNTLGILMRTMKLGDDNNEFRTVNSLLDLLNDATSVTLRRMCARQLQEKLKPPYAILVIPVEKNAGTYNFATAVLLPQLQSMYPDSITTMYDGALVTLVGGSRLNSIKESISNGSTDEFGIVMEKFSLLAGISMEYDDLELSSRYYKQSLLTAKLAEQKDSDRVYNQYTDYMPQQAFLNLVESGSPEAFVPPLLPYIKQYDNKNNTEYYTTLREYLRCFCNNNLVSKRLSIHRNTLLYRVNRMEKLFGISFEDKHMLQQLLVGIMIFDLL